jgi:head-tail adaptor
MARSLIDPRLLAALADAFPLTIQIQAATTTQDAYGAESQTWATIANGSIACCLWPDKGTEVRRSDQTLSVATHKALLAGYRSDVTVLHRAVVGAIPFDILAVQHDSQRLATRLLLEIVT